MRRLVLLLSLLVACDRGHDVATEGAPPSARATASAASPPAVEAWPALPADRAALEALVAQHEPRLEVGAFHDAEAIMRSLREGIAAGRVSAHEVDGVNVGLPREKPWQTVGRQVGVSPEEGDGPLAAARRQRPGAMEVAKNGGGIAQTLSQARLQGRGHVAPDDVAIGAPRGEQQIDEAVAVAVLSGGVIALELRCGQGLEGLSLAATEEGPERAIVAALKTLVGAFVVAGRLQLLEHHEGGGLDPQRPHELTERVHLRRGVVKLLKRK